MKRLLFQKLNACPSQGTDAEVHSSMEWNIAPCEVPIPLFGDAKELPSNDWGDADGDDEFVPDVIPMKSYEVTLKLAYKGNDFRTDLVNFLSYLAKGGMMKMYDEHRKIGRTGVRYVSFDPEAEEIHDGAESYIVFKVKVKVNDPITQISLSL